MEGFIKVDVYYYEDGNVRLLMDKKVNVFVFVGWVVDGIVREIFMVEKKY